MRDARSRAGTAAPTEVVTCFLRHRGDVLLVRRSARVGSYRGRWGGVAGHVETDDPLEDAWREIGEETGLQDAATLVRRGTPFAFDDAGEDGAEGRRWRVHPFLFDVARRDARLDWEAVQGAWVPPTAILERHCVPRLWTSYAHVAPTLEDVRDDREHGSAYLSLRALEVLRDRAAALGAGVEVPGDGDAGAAHTREAWAELARSLAAAQPAMTALHNRLGEAMSAVFDASGSAAVDGAELARRVAEAAQGSLHAALAAEDGTAAEAARRVAGRTVLTLSLSGTVSQALLTADPPPARVVVCASRPGGEGRRLASRLSASGIDTVLVPDAAVAWALERFAVELVLVGADTVLPDGAVVNKVGTRPAALAAHAAGVPVLAAAARAKVAAEGHSWSVDGEGAAADDASRTPESAGGGASAAGGAPAASAAPAWRSPLFERTPAELVDGIVTEDGVLGVAEVRAAAALHAARRARFG